MAQRLKVLLLAYACDREDVSETWCSYHWTSALARLHDATVLAYNKPSRAGCTAAQVPEARVIEWTQPRALARLGAFNDMVKPGYVHYRWLARRALRRLLQTEHFDLVHQYEPFAPRYPSPAVGLGIPFVLGPVGGGVDTPPGLRGEAAGSMAWFTQLRAVDRLRFRIDPWLRRTYAAANLVLGIAPYVRDLIGDLPLRRFDLMHETGIESVPTLVQREPHELGALRLLYVGRIVRTKGVRDAVRAMARLADLPGVTLDVVGHGDDRAACEADATRLGLAGRVRFHGWLPRDEVRRFYAGADAFVFPSFREASGTVVIEAMSWGLPLVVADWGGPGYTVSPETGIAVPPTSPEGFVTGIADAVRRLATAPGLVSRMGAAARAHVERDFLWDRKAERMTELYHEVLTSAAGSPPAV